MLKEYVKLMSRFDRSRLVGTLIVVILINGFNLFYFNVASANITIDGETVYVETDGYAVQFDKGVITYIHNKHTDKTYTLSTPQGKKGWTGLMFNRYFWEIENISTRDATLVDAIQPSANEAELLFRQRDTDVLLAIAVDPVTDDLLIDLEGVSGTPGVVGLQWGLGDVDSQNLSVIAPIDGGRILTATTGSTYLDSPYPFSSAGWEAQLAIVQGERGGFYVRNTDNTFQFKRFTYARGDDDFALNFGTYNQAPFDTDTTGSSTMWRFNTYAGDWRVPARQYRDWMEHAFDAKRLSEKAAWLEDTTLYVGNTGSAAVLTRTDFLDALATKVDPAKTVVMLASWTAAQEWSRDYDDYEPIYEPLPELSNFLEVAKRHGFPVILYTFMHSFSPVHPLYPEFMQYQYRDPWTGELQGWYNSIGELRNATMNHASSAFREIFVSQLKAVWDTHDIDGFLLDSSFATINDANGLIDGLNSAQGTALLHRELAEAMPGAIFVGERLHEATFALESFAIQPIFAEERKELHPISSFLFSPFTHAISDQLPNPDQDPIKHQIEHQKVLDYSKVWGIMPTLHAWEAEHLLNSEKYPSFQQVLARAGGWQHRYGLNGDVNSDGIVNILDLTLVGRNIGVPLARPEADINGDGEVNVLDLILVANMF